MPHRASFPLPDVLFPPTDARDKQRRGDETDGVKEDQIRRGDRRDENAREARPADLGSRSWRGPPRASQGDWGSIAVATSTGGQSRSMSDMQPSGTVTLVFTDVEGSTKLLEELGTGAYRDALGEHRRVGRSHYAKSVLFENHLLRHPTTSLKWPADRPG